MGNVGAVRDDGISVVGAVGVVTDVGEGRGRISGRETTGRSSGMEESRTC